MIVCLTKPNIEKTSETLNLIAQPLRLQIICMLNKQEKVCVYEMIEKFKIKQNLISHHLSMLKRIWIVKTQRQWVKIFYSLEKKVYEKFKTNLQNIFNI